MLALQETILNLIQSLSPNDVANRESLFTYSSLSFAYAGVGML